MDDQLDSLPDLDVVSCGLPDIAVTKTAPPAASRIRIERLRLLDLLQASAERRLILVKAPAGYGKTTLAVDWCEQLKHSGAVAAWLSVDVDDNEPGSFAYHIAKTIQRAAPGLGRSALDLLAQAKLIEPRNVVSAAINAMAERDDEIYLFLDDYHAITANGSHELTAFLLRYASSNFHLVIMSRTDPPLPISRLRLTDELAEFDVGNLRFTLDETKEFLSAEKSTQLEPADVVQLHQATEGWPAALQLARISLRNSPDSSKTIRSFSGASRKISGYIDDTLATQADEIVQFLLLTAILDRLHGSLCHAVTGVARSAELLKILNEEQLLLTALDEESGWYRYHHLMSDFLVDRLRTKMADRIPDLHRRAYRWYAANQMWSHAVQHAIAAKDFEQAARYIDHCAMSLIGKGDFLTLIAWQRQFPPELMNSQVHMKLALTWGMALALRFDEANALLKQVESIAVTEPAGALWWKCRISRAAWHALSDDSAQGSEIAIECTDHLSHYDAFEINSVWNVLRYGYLRAGEWDRFYALPKPDPGIDETTYVLAENFRFYLYGFVSACKLRINEALAFYSDARALAEKHLDVRSASATMVTGMTALLWYERGDVEAAEIAVLDDLDVIEATAYHDSFLSAYTVLIRAAMLHDELERALQLLDRGEHLARSRHWVRPTGAFLLERVRVLLRYERLDEAATTADRLRRLRSDHPVETRCSWSDVHVSSAVADGLIALSAGQTDAAVKLLLWAFNDLLATDNKHGALRVGLELAKSYFLDGNLDEARAMIGKVVGWAADAEFVSFLVERQQEFEQLLSTAREDLLKSDPGLTAFLEQATGIGRRRIQRNASYADRASKNALTKREISIIELIADGQSNKQIARMLGVAPETIKTHVKRIFVKLSAETRVQAVIRAQSLGLVRNIQAASTSEAMGAQAL